MARSYLFWDPLSDNIVQERDETGAVTAEYTTEPGLYGNVVSQKESGVESQFHFDGPGSTLAVTDDNQLVVATRAYSAFGDPTESGGTTAFPFQYGGQQGYHYDMHTSQHFIRRRQYHARYARWLAADPFTERGVYIYVYVLNNAVNDSDPSGMACKVCWQADKFLGSYPQDKQKPVEMCFYVVSAKSKSSEGIGLPDRRIRCGECEPVKTCQDLEGIGSYVKAIPPEPNPFPHCLAANVVKVGCEFIIGKNCKRPGLSYEECLDICQNSNEAAKILCGKLKEPYKTLCELAVGGGKQLCKDWCQVDTILVKEDKQKE